MRVLAAAACMLASVACCQPASTASGSRPAGSWAVIRAKVAPPASQPATLSAVGKSGSMTATVSGGGSGLWAFDAAQAVSVSPAAAAPEGVSFPFGVVSLQLTGGQAGQSATVEMSYPEALPANAKYYKFGKTADKPTDHWYEYPNARISGNKVVLTLTDGQTGDDDLSANGVIRDPGGVALVNGTTGPSTGAATPVPGLGQAGLLLLSGLVGALAWRRKRTATTA